MPDNFKNAMDSFEKYVITMFALAIGGFLLYVGICLATGHSELVPNPNVK